MAVMLELLLSVSRSSRLASEKACEHRA